MSAFRRLLVGGLVCLSGLAVAQSRDQLAAERVLGPRWKHVARAAGIIFTGSVLSVEKQAPTDARPIPTIAARFRVERAITGVQVGQVLTIREWAGSPTQRGLRHGQRMLFFFYPSSQLGLTSPVGGAVGQVELDKSGKWVAVLVPADSQPRSSYSTQRSPARQALVGVDQLERAIRGVRAERE